MIEKIEARIKEYETAVANSLANHNGLLGGLQELKNLLDMAVKVGEVIAPNNPEVQVVEVVDKAVDTL